MDSEVPIYIEGVRGVQIAQGDGGYENAKDQYATPSYADENRMSPALIVQAASKEDIAFTLNYAKAKKIAVAVRTGGHQYCGASSTLTPNI